MIKAARSVGKSGIADTLQLARRVLEIEADAVRALIERVDSRFAAAVELIARRKGRVVVSGMGKSGHIARKVASTLASTGTPAYFVHPAEASHGDLGMIENGDVFIAISYSGTSEELLQIVPQIKRRGAKLIAITGKPDSALAREADVHLDAAVAQEACPHNLARRPRSRWATRSPWRCSTCAASPQPTLRAPTRAEDCPARRWRARRCCMSKT